MADRDDDLDREAAKAAEQAAGRSQSEAAHQAAVRFQRLATTNLGPIRTRVKALELFRASVPYPSDTVGREQWATDLAARALGQFENEAETPAWSVDGVVVQAVDIAGKKASEDADRTKTQAALEAQRQADADAAVALQRDAAQQRKIEAGATDQLWVAAARGCGLADAPQAKVQFGGDLATAQRAADDRAAAAQRQADESTLRVATWTFAGVGGFAVGFWAARQLGEDVDVEYQAPILRDGRIVREPRVRQQRRAAIGGGTLAGLCAFFAGLALAPLVLRHAAGIGAGLSATDKIKRLLP